MACSARLMPFSILVFCLCYSSSGKRNCSKPGNSQGKALLPRPFLGAWWLFQTPYTGGGNGSCLQSTGTCKTDQNKHFATPRRVKGAGSEVLLKALDGKPLPALQRDVLGMCQCTGGDGKVPTAPEALSQLVVWGSLRLSSWAGCESVGRRDGSCTTACRCVPTLGGTPGHAGSQGFGGVKEAGLLAELSILTSSAGRCRASAKLLSLPKQKLGSPKLTEGSIQNKHMSSHVVSDTSGWEVVESPGRLQLPALNTHLSSPFPIWHCHDCIGVQPRLCRPCFPPQTSLPPLPGVLEGSRVLVSHGPLHSPCSIIPFHSSLP